jgi:hypothetical protein
MYVAAWPLLTGYPGQDFQSGLFGTRMFSQYDGKKPEKAYSDIEGGLGWWRDNRTREQHVGDNLGLVRRVALSLLKQDPTRGSRKGKRFQAALDKNYLMRVLRGFPAD